VTGAAAQGPTAPAVGKATLSHAGVNVSLSCLVETRPGSSPAIPRRLLGQRTYAHAPTGKGPARGPQGRSLRQGAQAERNGPGATEEDPRPERRAKCAVRGCFTPNWLVTGAAAQSDRPGRGQATLLTQV